MRDAELVQLAPGEMHIQQSSWVLLKGTLRITGHAAFVPAGMPGAPLVCKPGLDLVCMHLISVEISRWAWLDGI